MVKPRKNIVPIVVLSAWSLVLTGLTGLFGAVPLRGLRVVAGAWFYWVFVLASSLGFLTLKWSFLALAFLFLALVVGLYTEFEERDLNLGSASVASILVTALFGGGVFAFWLSQRGGGWKAELLALIEARMSEVPTLFGRLQIEASDVLRQAPSLFVIFLILALFFSLIFQRRLLAAAGFNQHRKLKLSELTLPEPTIWFFLLGLGMAFLGPKESWISTAGTNLLNVMVLGYFFQGLAVLVRSMDLFKMGWVAKLIAVLVIASQLLPLVSVIGLSDYWMDWRAKLSRRADQASKSKQV